MAFMSVENKQAAMATGRGIDRDGRVFKGRLSRNFCKFASSRNQPPCGVAERLMEMRVLTLKRLVNPEIGGGSAGGDAKG